MPSFPARFLMPSIASTLRSPTSGVRPPLSTGVSATWLSTVAYPLLGSLLWPGLILPVSTTYGVFAFACVAARHSIKHDHPSICQQRNTITAA